MIFLAPLFLLGLLGAGIPLVLHLRRAKRTKKLLFSHTLFFDQQFLQSARRARLQDLLLMLLRMALIVLLVAALSQPLLRLPSLSQWMGLTTGRRTVALILDDSASMSVLTRQGPLLDQARQSALLLLGELSTARGDRATVLLAGARGSGPQVLIPQPTTDLAAVRLAIQSIQPTQLGSDLNAALDQAVQTLGAVSSGSSGSQEIYLFSDFQRSNLPEQIVHSTPPNTGLILVAVQPDAQPQPNLSIDAIQYGAARPMVGVPFTFRTLLSNHSSQSRNVMLNLVIDDQIVQRQTVEVPAGRGRIIRMVHRFTTPGWVQGKISLEPQGPDALEADNHRYMVLHVRDQLHILAVNGAPSQVPANDELFFFRLALAAGNSISSSVPTPTGGENRADTSANPRQPSTGPGVQLEVIDLAELTAAKLQNVPLVLLANVANLSPTALETLERYVDQGGNLLITLGDRVLPDAYQAWVGPNRLHHGLLPATLLPLKQAGHPLIQPVAAGASLTAEAGPDPLESQNPAAITWTNLDHPALAGFTDGDLGSLSSVTLKAWYPLQPQEDANVLLTGPQQTPLLLEKRFGQGRVMILGTTLDRDWNDLPLQPTYVPWVYRLVTYLAQPSFDRAGFAQTGQVITLPTSSTKIANLQIQSPDGKPNFPVVGMVNGSTSSLVFSATEKAGIYQIRDASAGQDAPLVSLIAVNLPPEESDTRYLAQTDFQEMIKPQIAWAWINDPPAIATTGRLARQGVPMWDYLLALALIAALLEPWIANHLARRRSLADTRSSIPGGLAA